MEKIANAQMPHQYLIAATTGVAQESTRRIWADLCVVLVFVVLKMKKYLSLR